MLVHSVYFWLNDGLSEADLVAFRAGLEGLRIIPTVTAIYVGTPAATDARPVIDSSYTFGLTVVFEDLDGQNAYQVHQGHTDFLKTFSSMWNRVVIYDAD